MTVSREELERTIARLRDEVADPRAGVFGPDSMAWLVDREMITFVAGGRAALLQLAHPFVAHGVDRHSATRHDPFGRFRRTFQHVGAMVFGDLDHAISSARRVHAIHSRIYGTASDGTRYDANDEDALMWVHATLVDSAIMAFEQVVRPLSSDERERYYEESRRFALLFGIPDHAMPEDWDAFQRYNRRMHDWLRVAAPAREMSTFLLSPPQRVLAPFASWYRVMTAGLLPEPVRRQFGFRFGRAERVAFASSMPALRILYRALPDGVRYTPAYTFARARLAGETRVDPVAVWLDQQLFQS